MDKPTNKKDLKENRITNILKALKKADRDIKVLYDRDKLIVELKEK